MADTKITGMTASTAPASTDIVPVVVDPGGSPLNRKVTLGNLSKGLDAGLIPNTPAGTIAATNVQAALNELDTDKLATGGTAAAVTNATLTTALTVNTGTVTLTGNVANTSALTLGAGASSVSGSNTGDQTNISGNAATVTTNANLTGAVTSVGNATTMNSALDDLTDVVIATPAVDEFLRYNGSNWVNGAGATSSAGPGIQFFNATPNLIAATTDNLFAMNSLSKTPIVTAEQTISGTAATNTVGFAAWLYDTALGRTTIDAGVWNFETFAAVNSVAAGRVTTLTRQIYSADPFATGTVTITGAGTSRTATASAGTPFAVASIDASATNTTASYLQTPNGLFQITARTSDTVVTIETLTTYVNEAAVAGTVWKKLFGSTSSAITATGTNYSLQSFSTSQAAFTISLTTKLGAISFVTSNNTTTLTLTYNGTARNTHFSTPLITMHNNLAGLQGGTGNEMYHMTSAEYTGTGTGTVVRAGAPTFTSKITAGVAGGTTGSIELKGTTSGTATITVPAIAGTPTYTLPAAVGASGTFLKDAAGNGTLSWAVAGGSYIRSSTKTVAASNSVDTTNADYICDGTADEVQIQAAIDAVTTVGGTVQLMDGTYNIAASIIVKSNVILTGVGNGTLVKRTVNTTKIFDTGAAVTDFELSNMLIDGLTASDTTLIDFADHSVSKSKLIGLKTANCRKVLSFDNLNNSLIEGNEFIGSTGTLCENSFSTNSDRNTVIGNLFQVSTGIGLQNASRHWVVTGNRFIATGNNSNSIFSSDTATSDLVFSNNYIEKATISPAAGTITGNISYLAYVNGFSIFGTSGGVVSNNLILDAGQAATNTYYGIILNGASNDNLIVSNNTVISTTANVVKYGIYQNNSGSNYVKINDNVLKGFATAAVFITDTTLTESYDNFGSSPSEEVKLRYMKNTSGGALAAGDLVILKSVAAGNEVTTSTTAGDNKVFGMATAAISDTAYGYIQTLGKTTLMKVDGTVAIAIGDYITQSGVAKIGVKGVATNTVIAIALEAYSTADANGVIDALIIQPRLI